MATLRRLSHRAHTASDERERRQDIAICIVLTVAVVETFLNVFFRVAVESTFRASRNQVLSDISAHQSLERKLRTWPSSVLGAPIDWRRPGPLLFRRTKAKRNRLMHFTSSHESVELPGIALHGLADTSVFDDLTESDAIDAVHAAVGMVEEILRLRGVTPERMPYELRRWTGFVAN
jgi:hypothetical protein